MLAALSRLTRFFESTAVARVRAWLAGAALLLAALLLARIFVEQARLETWLFFRYALVWLCTLAFAAACLSSGNWLVTRWCGDRERGLAHFVLAFSTGVYAFFALTALIGFLEGFGPVFFFAAPLALFALGARQLWRDLVALRVQRESWSLSPLETAAFGLGGVALFVIYQGVLVPENAAYDARWYHLGLAEHYAAAGGVLRSAEGAVTATVPHLASFLYAWAYCLPWGGLFERVELCAHVEFISFVMTLPGIVALVRELVPGARARGAWLWMFAFPSIFLYDSSLHNAADHIAALWTIPTYLALVRALDGLRPRDCALFAVQAAGLLMSKYTAIIAVLGPVLALTLRGLYLTVRQLLQSRRAPALWGLASALGAGLLLTTPHWLKNWFWHGDPLYPVLHRYLTLRPWGKDGPFLFAVYSLADGFVATGSIGHRLQGAFKALYDHSYALYNWADFHGAVPVFGSLFTFCLLALPFLRGARRLWGIVLMTHLGIAFWYWSFHHERYLQTLLPWMASVVASVFLLAWRSGLPARLGVMALAGLQIVWGLDMPFWPLNRMTGKSGIGLASDFFARGYAGRGNEVRTKPFEDLAAVGRVLPPRAKVLVHHDHLHAGLGTMTVTDSTRIQYGLSYAELGSPRALHQRLREYGVTHVLWEPNVVYGDETVGGDLVFHATARYWRRVRQSPRNVGALPAADPPLFGSGALVYLCDGTYLPGVYRVTDLSVSPYVLPGQPKRYPLPRAPMPVSPTLDGHELSYAVVNERCAGAPSFAGKNQIAAAGAVRYFALPTP